MNKFLPNRAGERLIILNRASKTREGWIHIVPRGELPNADAGIIQVLDDAALDSIYNRLQAEHSPADAPGLYAGREHFIYDGDKDSEALAWFKTFNRDADGIWAKADGLTDLGQEAVKNKRYKFTSFAADSADLKKVEGKKYRVMGIETVGFTNMPVGRELLNPITNRNTFAGAGAQAANQEKQTKGNTMKTVLAELGLDADAAEQSALAATIKLKNRLAALEPLEGEIKTLKNRVEKLDGANVDSLLKQHGITDEKVMNRMRPLIAKIETPEERSQFLVDCNFKPVEGKTETKTQTRLFNRETKPPGGAETGTEEDNQAEKELAGKIMNRAGEIMKENKNISRATAVTMAQRELAPVVKQ